MRKSVAIGIAGLTGLVVAAWRQIQRDNSIETGSGSVADSPPKASTPRPAAEAKPEPSSPGSALFKPSVSEDSTKAELYEVATELEVEGRSKMNKAELLKAIRSAS